MALLKEGIEVEPRIKGTVCVTGATGHLGSWLVMRLLEKGYRVRAAVQDPDNKSEISVLTDLRGAAERLEIVKADLLVEQDFDTAIEGCDGVFHLACPTNFAVDDPQKELIDPAVKGTLNVLKACAKSSSIRRVVHTSSAAAVRFTGKEYPDQVFDESCWTDVELCLREKFHGWPYFVGKTLGEKQAIEFARQNNINLVSIIPALVSGPFLIPRIPNSVTDSLALVRGDVARYPFMKSISYVHIDDVVEAHIFLYENEAAEGRHICSSVDATIEDVAELLSRRYPEFNIPTNNHQKDRIFKLECRGNEFHKDNPMRDIGSTSDQAREHKSVQPLHTFPSILSQNRHPHPSSIHHSGLNQHAKQK